MNFKTVKIYLFYSGLIATIIGCSTGGHAMRSDHHNGEQFFNPTLPDNRTKIGLFKGLKMWFTMERAEWPTSVKNTARPDLHKTLSANDVAITFVNHATFLLQWQGLTILTDPVWAKRVSPLSFYGPSRVREPGIAFADLPKIDLILISHNHYDHLDKETLKQLAQRDNPMTLVAMNDGELVRSLGLTNVVEMDWWQDIKLSDGTKITYAPTQHFSSRGLFDRNKSLWGSYMIDRGGKRVYFGGDAGYSSHYKDIEARLGAPDVALLGIGAYEPNWFMKPMHTNPAEALQAHIDLKAKTSIGMHFGTFQLSAEPIDQPERDLKSALSKMNIPEAQFIVMDVGQTRLFAL